MSNRRYLFVVFVAVMAGFIGGAVSGPLGAALVTQFIQPRHIHARKAFVLIDKQGKRRAVLNQRGLTFFDEHETPTATLGYELMLTGGDPTTNTYTRVQVNPTAAAVVTFTRGQAFSTVLTPLIFPGPPKLGIGKVDDTVIWNVPSDAIPTEQTGP